MKPVDHAEGTHGRMHLPDPAAGQDDVSSVQRAFRIADTGHDSILRVLHPFTQSPGFLLHRSDDPKQHVPSSVRFRLNKSEYTIK